MTKKNLFPRRADNTIDMLAWLETTEQTHGLRLKKINLLKSAIDYINHYTNNYTNNYASTYINLNSIEQALITADILLDLKCDQESAVAAILWNAIQSTYCDSVLEEIKQRFGESIAKLIHSAQQITLLNSLTTSYGKRGSTQTDRLRKIFLVMAADIRVVVMKLAERLAVLRQIKVLDETEQKKIAQETLDIYAPLANRLGIGQLKWELEDLAFHYTQPAIYKKIADFLAEKRMDREQRIHHILLQLEERFTQANLTFSISGRAKHIYSIYLKSQKKNLDYNDIYDYSAVRILVPTIMDCYTALSLVNDLWEQLPSEFDDYIAHPKSNGYRSIHTAVIDTSGKHLEIQIRTNEMHKNAEQGAAAHWIYKEGKNQQEEDKIKMDFLRQLVAWQAEISDEKRNPEKSLQEIFSDRIYVLTPQGDILDLVVGATPLDFAYLVHSSLGHRCRGAKVNGQIVPLTHSLQTGDRVEIMTSQRENPSRDWLKKEAGYIKSSHARKKILQWFKQQQHALKNTAASLSNIKHETIKPALEKEKEKEKHTISSPHKSPALSNVLSKIRLPIEAQTNQLNVGGLQSTLLRIAKCCHPEPGDDVTGYITQGNGVSIHRSNCKNIAYLAEQYKERFITANWTK